MITFTKCDHRITEFKSFDNGYDIICLKCGQILKSERNINKTLLEFEKLIFSLAIVQVCMEENLKVIGLLYENNSNLKGGKE